MWNLSSRRGRRSVSVSCRPTAKEGTHGARNCNKTLVSSAASVAARKQGHQPIPYLLCIDAPPMTPHATESAVSSHGPGENRVLPVKMINGYAATKQVLRV